MFQRLKCIRQLLAFIRTPLGLVFMRVFCYTFIANCIAGIHLLLILANLVSLACLIAYEPFYIWLPFLTLVSSPMMGGTHCLFNRIENIYRVKAGLPLITDRLEAFLGGSK